MTQDVNDLGMIPDMRRIIWRGKLTYYRECSSKDFFRIFQGFGMSKSLLETLDKTLDYLICYKGKNKEKHYLTSIKAFIESDKEFNNAGVDLQKVVSIKDMELIEND